MWQCKYCEETFNFVYTSDKANHSRWCNKNPKRNDWNKTQGNITKFGDFQKFEVRCSSCNNSLLVEEREKLFPQKKNYYCNRICANSVGGRAKAELYHSDSEDYRTIAFRHHKRECIVCGFDKIVSVHHIDENHYNNDPKNLVTLCPNHHHMVHSNAYKEEVQKDINKYLEERWGTGLLGVDASLARKISVGFDSLVLHHSL